MRKIIDKILNQKKFILGTIFGVMIMGGISYAANNYTSESVSYTRGNDTMSVKQALDDLIVKVDKKSGNFNIELAERPLGINFTESTTTYQSLVNDLLGRMITAMGTANTADLSAIKSSTLTWKSEDPNTASVTGTVVKGVKEGKTKIIGTATNGKQVIVPVNVKSAVVLAEKAHVGEYVAYDAGQWNADAARPTKSGQFGGYSKNQSKNASVEWCNNDSHKTTLQGWRILDINTSTKTVTIVHAGQPECYYHGTNTNSSKTYLDNRADTEYKNSIYADSAHAMTYDEANSMSVDLRKTGDLYWLATAYSGTDLYRVGDTGSIYINGTSNSYGFRPVVVLKSGILTTGQVSDGLGHNNAWNLVLPS